MANSQLPRRQGTGSASKPSLATLSSLVIDISNPAPSTIPPGAKSESSTPTMRSVLSNPTFAGSGPRLTRGGSLSSTEVTPITTTSSSVFARNRSASSATSSPTVKHGHSTSGSSSSTLAAAPGLHSHSAAAVVSVPSSPALAPLLHHSPSNTSTRKRPSRPTLSATNTTVTEKVVPGPASAPASTTNIPPAKRPPIPKRYGVHESFTHPPQYYRRMPHHHAYTTEQAPPSLMHWSKAAAFGSLPTHPMRSHTSVLVDTVVWTFGGRSNTKGTRDGTGVRERVVETARPVDSS